MKSVKLQNVFFPYFTNSLLGLFQYRIDNSEKENEEDRIKSRL